MRKLRVGISTCPNDTFAFHGLLSGRVQLEGIELAIELTDIEDLNTGLLEGRYDVCKASTHVAVVVAEKIRCLPVGWALGFGLGPVVLSARGGKPPEHPRVLMPGRWTTAALLWQLFHPEPAEVRQVVFSEIVPALRRGAADLGVCIHEGRFTYAEQGLHLVEDLGTTWEHATGEALPLGGLVAARNVEEELLGRFVAGVRRSIACARENPGEALVTMRRHAQEDSDEVLWKHVELYVNDQTVELGEVGRAAILALSQLAASRGLLTSGQELPVFRCDS